MKIGLVCTTIGDGSFLAGYCKKAEEEGLKNDVTFYVIPDRKTPDSLYAKCYAQIEKGFNVWLRPTDKQRLFLKSINFDLVPYDSDNRRNVGYLKAYADNNDLIISIDDDNFCIEDNKPFFREHSEDFYTGSVLVETGNKWYNVCQDLKLPEHIYPRGYPQMYKSQTLIIPGLPNCYVDVNAGLWLIHPDLDAITWLANTGIRSSVMAGESIILADNTWAPINSQNTSVTRRALPAYYFIPMGGGFDRYGDIFQGYFLEACVKSMGNYIRFGTPLVNHIRNSHNYLEDARKEIYGLSVLEELITFIQYVNLDGSTYEDKYLSLASQLEDTVERLNFTVDIKAYWHRVAYCMRQWIKACQVLA